MKRLIAALIVTTPLLAAVPAVAQTAPARAETPAFRLAGLMLPRDAMTAVSTRSFGKAFDGVVDGDAEKRTRYQANPGMRDYVRARVSKVVVARFIEDLPELRGEIAGVISREMKPDVIAATLAFFETPTGKKLQSAMYAAMGEADDPEAAKGAAMENFAQSLTPADYVELGKLNATGAPEAMQRIGPKIAQVSEAWGVKRGKALRPLMLSEIAKAEAEFGAGKR